MLEFSMIWIVLKLCTFQFRKYISAHIPWSFFIYLAAWEHQHYKPYTKASRQFEIVTQAFAFTEKDLLKISIPSMDSYSFMKFAAIIKRQNYMIKMTKSLIHSTQFVWYYWWGTCSKTSGVSQSLNILPWCYSDIEIFPIVPGIFEHVLNHFSKNMEATA